MLFGNRRPRNVTARDHDIPVFQPRCERLEAKILMAIDLGGTSPPTLPFIATARMASTWPAQPPTAGAGYQRRRRRRPDRHRAMTTWSSAHPRSPAARPRPSAQRNRQRLPGFRLAVRDRDQRRSPSRTGSNVNGATQLVRQRPRRQSRPARTRRPRPIPSTARNLNFPFTGVTFTGVAVAVGASVAGVTLPGDKNAILIGAPNSNGGAGCRLPDFRQFRGACAVRRSTSTPPASSGLNIVTFINTATYAAGGQLGFSVAGGINILGDGAGDIILGAPNASVAPTNTTTPVAQNTGVVYVISTAVLSGSIANDRRLNAHRPRTQVISSPERPPVTRRAFRSPTAATSTVPRETSTIS